MDLGGVSPLPRGPRVRKWGSNQDVTAESVLSAPQDIPMLLPWHLDPTPPGFHHQPPAPHPPAPTVPPSSSRRPASAARSGVVAAGTACSVSAWPVSGFPGRDCGCRCSVSECAKIRAEEVGRGVEDCARESRVGALCPINSVSGWEVGYWEPDNLDTSSAHTAERPVHCQGPDLLFWDFLPVAFCPPQGLQEAPAH